MARLILAVLFVALVAVNAQNAEYRYINGTNNNLANPIWGAIFQRLQRISPEAYEDGISIPRGGFASTLPNPRNISNMVFGMGDGIDQPQSVLGLTALLTFWGQFLDHDMGLTAAPNPISEPDPPQFFNVTVPSGDAFFDPMGTGTVEIMVQRSIFEDGTGVDSPREQINLLTALFDTSNVYGEIDSRAEVLRLGVDGLLNTTNGGLYLPRNDLGLPNAADGSPLFPDRVNELWLGGDIRVLENPGLAAMHTVWVRQHNIIAAELRTANPDWDDETLYQEARRWVNAIYSHITFDDWAPVVFGRRLPDYAGYDADVNGGIFQETSSACFRVGHTMITAFIFRRDANGMETTGGDFPLRESFFIDPELIISEGIDPILRGLRMQPQNEIDIFIVDDLRNFLFGEPGEEGLDLISINIQRAREHGIGSLNEVRVAFGLTAYTDFDFASDAALNEVVRAAYNDSIDDVDLWVALAEPHDFEGGALLPETFRAVIERQFTQMRDGDRFYYRAAAANFTTAEIQQIEETTFGDFIVSTSEGGLDNSSVQCYVFAMADGCRFGTPYAADANADFRFTTVEKTSDHPGFGQGARFGFAVNGVQNPSITLVRGTTYTFQSQANCQTRAYLSTSLIGGGRRNTVVAGSPNYGRGACAGSTFDFTPEAATPDTIYYASEFQLYFGGSISVVDAGSTTGVATTGASQTQTQTGTGTSNTDEDSSSSTVVASVSLILAIILALF